MASSRPAWGEGEKKLAVFSSLRSNAPVFVPKKSNDQRRKGRQGRFTTGWKPTWLGLSGNPSSEPSLPAGIADEELEKVKEEEDEGYGKANDKVAELDSNIDEGNTAGREDST